MVSVVKVKLVSAVNIYSFDHLSLFKQIIVCIVTIYYLTFQKID